MHNPVTTTLSNNLIAEEYSAQQQHNGDIILTCRTPGADVLRPTTFRVPADLRMWLAAAIAPRSTPTLTSDALADQMRSLARGLPTEPAVRLELLANAVGRMETRLDETFQTAREDFVAVAGCAKVVPISCGINRRFS